MPSPACWSAYSPPCHAEVPLEALADDENLAALEAGQEGELALDSGELDCMDVTPKKKGKAKAKAPSQQGSKAARAEDANASSSMQVRYTHHTSGLSGFLHPSGHAEG